MLRYGKEIGMNRPSYGVQCIKNGHITNLQDRFVSYLCHRIDFVGTLNNKLHPDKWYKLGTEGDWVHFTLGLLE